jgi:hypothetical protein
LNRIVLYLLLVFAASLTSCSEKYYDDSVRTPRGGGDYRDSYSSYGYNKKKQKYLDSYSSKRVRKNQKYHDSYSTKSKNRGRKAYKDSYSTKGGGKRKIKFYDSFSTKKKKKSALFR